MCANPSPRYIPKTLPTMPAGQWAVWDTKLDCWVIYAGYPAISTASWEEINQRCQELNKRS
jgi:hypothetical protein